MEEYEFSCPLCGHPLAITDLINQKRMTLSAFHCDGCEANFPTDLMLCEKCLRPTSHYRIEEQDVLFSLCWNCASPLNFYPCVAFQNGKCIYKVKDTCRGLTYLRGNEVLYACNDTHHNRFLQMDKYEVRVGGTLLNVKRDRKRLLEELRFVFENRKWRTGTSVILRLA